MKCEKGLQIPVSASFFSTAIAIAVTILVLFSLAMIYIAIELYKFANTTQNSRFFSTANKKRLRMFGTFIIVVSISSFLLQTSIPWILSATAGVTGFTRDFNFNALPEFPFALVTGLLMFIMAEAFGKAQTLESENNLTI